MPPAQAANPTVSIVTTDPLASEGAANDPGVYTLYRVGGDLNQQLTINYELPVDEPPPWVGATLGTDYTLTGPGLTWDDVNHRGTVLFPATQAEITVVLAALDDAPIDGNEYVKFRLLGGTGYSLGTTVAYAAIGDTDGGLNSVAVLANDPCAVEPVVSGAKGLGVFTVCRAGNVQDQLTIRWTRQGSYINEVEWPPGTPPYYYTDFPAGAYSAAVRVYPIYDTESESGQTVRLELSDPGGQSGQYQRAWYLWSAQILLRDFPSSLYYTLQTVDYYSAASTLTVPYAVNESRSVVGGYLPYSPYPWADGYGFRWSGRLTDSGQFAQIGPIIPGYYLDSLAAGINNLDQIVGCSDNGHTWCKVPFFWENGVFTVLTPPSGWCGYGDNRIGNALNDSGLIVGTMVNPQGTLRAVKWASKTGTGEDMGQMTPFYDPSRIACAAAVSPNGRIVGKAQLQSGVFHAFKTLASDQDVLKPWSDLGVLPGSAGNSEAWAINTRDEVAGASQNASGQWRAFVIRSTGGMVALTPAQGGSWSKAYGINGNGFVVGQSTNYWGYSKATLWYHTGVVPYALESLVSGGLPAGWTELTSAEAINDDGQIAGWGIKNGVQKGFLLTPIWWARSCRTGSGRTHARSPLALAMLCHSSACARHSTV